VDVSPGRPGPACVVVANEDRIAVRSGASSGLRQAIETPGIVGVALAGRTILALLDNGRLLRGWDARALEPKFELPVDGQAIVGAPNGSAALITGDQPIEIGANSAHLTVTDVADTWLAWAGWETDTYAALNDHRTTLTLRRSVGTDMVGFTTSA
jgi:hypothetical protein